MHNVLKDVQPSSESGNAAKLPVSSRFDELFDRLNAAIAKKYGKGILAHAYWKSQWIGKEDELLERVLKLESENGC